MWQMTPHSIVSPCRSICQWIPCTGWACVTMLLRVTASIECDRPINLWDAECNWHLFVSMAQSWGLKRSVSTSPCCSLPVDEGWQLGSSCFPLIMTDGTRSTNTWLHMSKVEQKFVTCISFGSDWISQNLSGTYMHFIPLKINRKKKDLYAVFCLKNSHSYLHIAKESNSQQCN